MKVVVKIGGAALDNPELVKGFAKAVVGLTKAGHNVVVVHGGGAALSRTMKELGRESQFINGLRVTDLQTRDVAIMVLAGQLNKQLVASIGRAGHEAIGLCGGDFRIIRAAKKKGDDLGYVGEICSVESKWFGIISDHGAIPVIASIALGNDGEYYNVNADSVASACAVAWKADALIFLTDVPGVKGAGGDVIRWLDIKDIEPMREKAVISGGMLPKLSACTSALKKGVGRVRIMPATSVDALPGFFTHRIDSGTEVIVQ